MFKILVALFHGNFTLMKYDNTRGENNAKTVATLVGHQPSINGLLYSKP